MAGGNPNLGSSQMVPGFYGFIDYNAQGTNEAPDNRALIWGYITATAQRTPNRPFLPASQQEADDGCGQGSNAANEYAAAMSQPESAGAAVWIMPIAEPSGGVASTYKIKVIFAGSATAPAKAGTIDLWIGSRPVASIGFTTTDTATSIGDAIVTSITGNKDLPIASAVNASGTVTITYIHKGAIGEDLPIRCRISPTPQNCGVYLSLGSLVFAGASATGAGSVKVSFGALSVSAALAGGEAPAAVATKVIAAFNGDTYPLFAVVDNGSTSTVNLMMANDRDVRRITAAVITSTTLTVNLGSGATDGTGSASSLTYNGTQGTGAPSLTSALANLDQESSFRAHAAPWTDTTTVGALATKIEADSNGSITGQKQQRLFLCSFDTASNAGAIATGASPNLTTTAPHYGILHSPDNAVTNGEDAARVAAAFAGTWLDAPNKNWNGFKIQGNEKAPHLLSATKMSISSQNTDLVTYALAPVVRGRSGYMEIVKGRSTSLAADKRLWAWSAESQAAWHVLDLKNVFAARFAGGSILRYGQPVAPGTFDKSSFVSTTRERMKEWEALGNYDGADALSPAVVANPDPANPFRINVEFPESPVVDLDQVVFTDHFTSP